MVVNFCLYEKYEKLLILGDISKKKSIVSQDGVCWIKLKTHNLSSFEIKA